MYAQISLIPPNLSLLSTDHEMRCDRLFLEAIHYCAAWLVFLEGEFWYICPMYLSACVRVTVQCRFESKLTLSRPQTKHSGCADPPVAPTFQRGSWECRSVPPVEHLTGSRWFISQCSRLIHVTTWEPGTSVQKHKTSHAGESRSRKTRWAKDEERECVCHFFS